MNATNEAVSDTRWAPAFFAPSRYLRAPRTWITDIGLAATMVVAVMAFLSRAVTRDAEVLVFLTVLVSARYVLRTDPRAWLYFVLAAFAVWMQVVDNFFHIAPQAAENSPVTYSRYFAKMYFFMFAGWWLGGRSRNAGLLLAGGMIGALLRIVATASTRDWSALINVHRTALGYFNAQHTAALLGSIIVGLLAFAPWFLRRGERSRAGQIVFASIWSVLLALSVAMLRVTETRAAWFGLGVSAAITLPIGFYLVKREGLITRRRALVWGAGGVVILVGVIALNPMASAWSRMQSDWPGIQKLLVEGKVPADLNGSAIRLLEWRFALNHIAERPIVGHGGGATKVLLERSDLPNIIRRNFGHVHNSFLDLALSYGLVAPAVVFLALGVLLVGVWRAYWRGRISVSMTLFGIAWISFFTVINCFETYVYFHTAYYMMFVCGGALYGATMEPRAGSQAASTPLSRST